MKRNTHTRKEAWDILKAKHSKEEYQLFPSPRTHVPSLPSETPIKVQQAGIFSCLQHFKLLFLLRNQNLFFKETWVATGNWNEGFFPYWAFWLKMGYYVSFKEYSFFPLAHSQNHRLGLVAIVWNCFLSTSKHARGINQWKVKDSFPVRGYNIVCLYKSFQNSLTFSSTTNQQSSGRCQAKEIANGNADRSWCDFQWQGLMTECHLLCFRARCRFELTFNTKNSMTPIPVQ